MLCCPLKCKFETNPQEMQSYRAWEFFLSRQLHWVGTDAATSDYKAWFQNLTQAPVSPSQGAPSLSKKEQTLDIEGCCRKPVCDFFKLNTIHQTVLEKQVALTKSRILMQEKGKIIVLGRWEVIVRPNQIHPQERIVIIIRVI